MKRLLFAVLLVTTAPIGAQVVTPASFTLEGYYDLQTFGDSTTWMRGLAVRYVAGDQRFLTLTHTGQIHEIRLGAAPFRSLITERTGTWALPAGVGGSHMSLTWEDARQRLWVTSTVDYGDASTYYPTKISVLTLGESGTVSSTKTISLKGITSKRLYGNVLGPLTSAQQSAMGCGGKPYLVGNGGYTSLMAATSRASLGPSLVCMADPDGYPTGAELPTSAFKILLDTPTNERGVRTTAPINYFDGGDPRQNPSTPPKSPPLSRAGWLSPDRRGTSWMVWGDSYYGNAALIGDTYVAIAALCQGKCWYQSSTLMFDGRTQEIHTWPLASLTGANRLTRPSAMAEVVLPRDNPRVWGGNIATGNVSGVAYDKMTGKLYAVIYPGGSGDTGRLYQFSVNAGQFGQVTPPRTSSSKQDD